MVRSAPIGPTIVASPTTIDPEARRVLLTEIAFQRAERSRFRAMAAEDGEPPSAQLRARLRAEGCTRAIHALCDVWHGLEAVERRHAEDELVAWAAERRTA